MHHAGGSGVKAATHLVGASQPRATSHQGPVPRGIWPAAELARYSLTHTRKAAADRTGGVTIDGSLPSRNCRPSSNVEVAELVRRGPDLAQHGVVRWRRIDLSRVMPRVEATSVWETIG
jgi:hypothetical protein